jgi:tRNA nucleotidyltransferase (CCA-adding enzyme)
MNIAFGHTNPDLDCLGSLILIKKLFPEHRLIKGGKVHPTARGIYTLYRHHFDFVEAKEIKDERIDDVIVVDTCKLERVHEFADFLNAAGSIHVFDHHDYENCTIPNAAVHGAKVGANTSLLTLMAHERGIRLNPEEATIALTGVYADTGKLIFDSVCKEDFEAAMRLLDMGASLKLVKSFLETIKEDGQIEIMNQLLLKRVYKTIQGHSVLLIYHEIAENMQGLNIIVERIMEIENPDAFFACFNIRKSKTMLVISRCQTRAIDLNKLLQFYGGGGHKMAASAKIACEDGAVFFTELIDYLRREIKPALCARDIMTTPVDVVKDTATLLEASMFLEKIERSGVPVVGDAGQLCGFIGLRDIMKGRKARLMNAPVKAYMARNLVTANSSVTMRDIERIFYKNHIGHLPIVENGELAGIVTRWDYLQAQNSV